MYLKGQKVKTEFGAIYPREVVHCDNCGKKHLPEGAKEWLEIRRLYVDLPALHVCSFQCWFLLVLDLSNAGVKEINEKNWPNILDLVSKAGKQCRST